MYPVEPSLQVITTIIIIITNTYIVITTIITIIITIIIFLKKVSNKLKGKSRRNVHGFYYHFNNLRFKQARNLYDYSAAHVAT